MPAPITLSSVSNSPQLPDTGSAAVGSTSASPITISFAKVLKDRGSHRQAGARHAESPEMSADPSSQAATAAPQFLAMLQGNAVIRDDRQAAVAATEATAEAAIESSPASTEAISASAPLLLAAAARPEATVEATPSTGSPVTSRPAGKLSSGPADSTVPGTEGNPVSLATPQDRQLMTDSAGKGSNDTRKAADSMPLAGSQAKLAADPAKSAEPTKPVAGPGPDTKPGLSTEFKPLLEGFVSHAADGATPLQAMPQGNPSVRSAAPEALSVSTPVEHPAWSDDVGQRVSWMVSNGRQEADLVLNPPQLGRVEVTIVVEGDKVNASFSSPHQSVRDALESSMSRLREVLAETGVSLGQTHVGRDSSRDAPFARNDGQPHRSPPAGRDADAPLATIPQPSSWHRPGSSRMVDIFA